MSQAREETLVAMPAEGGFRVYAPSDPAHTYLVSGTASAPDCTCPEFREEVGDDPDYRCHHILAVESQLPQPTPLDDEDREERRAIQAEGAAPQSAASAVNPGAQMTIKRSASPDGRIDSLSVEFTCPVDGLTQGAIKAKATRTIRIQETIIGEFLEDSLNGKDGEGKASNGNGHHREDREDDRSDGDNRRNGPVSARLIDVQGMQTRYGWRMYINVQSGGKSYKLFGTRRELGDAISNAGAPDLARNLSSGTELDLPCRVTLKRSDDGRYQNVDEVFPAEENGARRERNRR